MKGTFFQKPLEFGLVIHGESWQQGDHIKGSLIVKNHGPENLDLSATGITLALGNLKKYKAKDPEAFTILGETFFNEGVLVDMGEERTLDWDFQLANDCAITEKTSSLFIICGEKDDYFGGGQMQLQINPENSLTQFLEIFKNFFKFQVKAIKNKNGFIEAKMVAPDSKELGAVEQLMLNMRMNGDDMDLKYTFKVNRVSYGAAGEISAKAKKEEYSQSLKPKQFRLFGDAPNQDGIIEAIGEVIEQVKTKSAFWDQKKEGE